MIKFCRKCQEEKRENCPSGYYFGWKDSVVNCPNCGYPMVNINFPAQDLAIIEQISEDVSFIEAMMNLRNKDIVEYNMKLSQFKAQLSQTKAVEESNKPHCPHCKSTKISKIGTGERVGSIAMWGIFSKKINKSFKCGSCGYTW